MSNSFVHRVHAAKTASGLPVVGRRKHARRSSKPDGTMHVASSSDHAARAGGSPLRIDLASRGIMRGSEVVDRIGHPFLDVSGHVVDSVTRAPEGKGSHRSELGISVAIIGIL